MYHTGGDIIKYTTVNIIIIELVFLLHTCIIERERQRQSQG